MDEIKKAEMKGKIQKKVAEHDAIGKIHFIKRGRIKDAVYDYVMRNITTYEEFKELYPFYVDQYYLIDSLLQEGKEIPQGLQQWYNAETQRRIESDRESKMEDIARQQAWEQKVEQHKKELNNF